MNVLINIDDNYAVQAATTLLSLRKNTEEVITVFLLNFEDCPLSQGTINRISAVLQSQDLVIPLVCPWPEELDDINLFAFKKTILLKMLAVYYLPFEMDRFLYLDCDVVIRGDITPFYDKKVVSKTVLLGTKETFRHEEYITGLGICDDTYLNVGVIMIYPRSYRSVFPTLSSLLARIISLTGEFRWPEQDIMNLLFDGMKEFWPNDKFMRLAELDYAIPAKTNPYRAKRPVIIHYASVNKPWKAQGHLGTFRFLYWKYAWRTYGLDAMCKYLCRRILWLLNRALHR